MITRPALDVSIKPELPPSFSFKSPGSLSCPDVFTPILTGLAGWAVFILVARNAPACFQKIVKKANKVRQQR